MRSWSPPDSEFRALRRGLAALALLQILFQASYLARGFEFVVARLPIDDAYYYLQVAWNTPRLGFVTFDGIHRTNGLQFIWCWILIALAALVPTKKALLIGSLILCLSMNALCHLPIYRLGRSTGRPLLTLLMAVAWFNVNLTTASWYLSGMENSLHALIVWSLAATMAELMSSAQGPRGATWIRFSILLVLNVWCRLDAALLSVAAGALALWRMRNRLSAGVLGSSLLMALLGAAGLFGGYYAMGRSWLPVSALIKKDANRWSLDLFPLLAARGFDFTIPVAFVLSPRLYPFSDAVRTIGAPLALGIPALALAGVLLARDASLRRGLAPVWMAFGVASLAHVLLLSGMGSYAAYGVWYQSPSIVFSAITLGLAGEGILRWARRFRPWALSTLRLAGALAGLLYLLFTGVWFLQVARDQEFRKSSFYAKYELCGWLRENTRHQDVLASFNAGEVAYFSDRTTINLDGLVNDYTYYRQVLGGSIPLRDYLSSNHVRYFVDFQVPDVIRRDSEVVYSKTQSEEHTFQVLDIAPERP